MEELKIVSAACNAWLLQDPIEYHKFVAQYTEFFKVRIIKKNQERSSNYLIKFMKKVMRGSIMNSVLKGS